MKRFLSTLGLDLVLKEAFHGSFLLHSALSFTATHEENSEVGRGRRKEPAKGRE